MPDVKLKILQVNDVYELHNLTYFAACKRQHSADCDKIIGVLPGDFVGPSLLSSLDKGYGMVDCLNLCGMDYVSIGNHENDIPLAQLHLRIKQSNFQWINSNMRTLPLPSDISLPEYSIVTIQNSAGQSKKIALVGLNTPDPNIYRKGAFGGCSIEPIKETLFEVYNKIMEKDPDVDAVIPMTHQLMPQDRDLANSFNNVNIPVIIGGHDHEPYLDVVNGCTIVKSGIDAKLLSIIQITWSDGCAKPQVVVQQVDAKTYSPDETVSYAITKHSQILKELEKTRLFTVPVNEPFSSKGIRLRPTSVGRTLCSLIRDSVSAECALIGAGSIRANKHYTNPHFTYADLKSEIPFETGIVAINLPGQVLSDMITYTRGFALQNPPVEKGGYIQTDDSIEWDSTTNRVLKVANEDFDCNRIYLTAINQGVLDGMDNIEPLLAYKASCPADDTNINKPAESAMGAKELIVSLLSKTLFFEILKSCNGIEGIDKDGDDRISQAELEGALLAQSTQGEFTKLLIQNLFHCMDLNGDGYISRSEIVSVSLTQIKSCKSNSRTDLNNLIDVNEVKEEAKLLLGNLYDETRFLQIFTTLDSDHNSFVTRKEFNEFIAGKRAEGAQNINI
jgi:2',3'-cyclic-nucleotide 2'-phosphodiesterase (5'-nucleotidase family)/Ca2+-binding EF-hand superfamily protein